MTEDVIEEVIEELIEIVELLELVDIEEHGKAGKPVPKAKSYRIRIDKAYYVVNRPALTGRELLTLAGKSPADQWMIHKKLKGGQTQRIGLDEMVDFTAPGIERFQTLPLDQTEGEMGRRQFTLPEEDREHLEAGGFLWETVNEGGTMWLVIDQYPIPEGYNHTQVCAAFRIQAGYPTAEIDMVFVHPALRRTDNQPIRCTDGTVTVDGRMFQQWSRHRTPQNPWRPGEDNLATHLTLVDDWFLREFGRG